MIKNCHLPKLMTFCFKIEVSDSILRSLSQQNVICSFTLYSVKHSTATQSHINVPITVTPHIIGWPSDLHPSAKPKHTVQPCLLSFSIETHPLCLIVRPNYTAPSCSTVVLTATYNPVKQSIVVQSFISQANFAHSQSPPPPLLLRNVVKILHNFLHNSKEGGGRRNFCKKLLSEVLFSGNWILNV